MSEEPMIRLQADFTSSEGGQFILRQPMLGMGPSILIQPNFEEDGDVVFEVEACDFSPDQCADVLEMLAEAIRNRTEEPA